MTSLTPHQFDLAMSAICKGTDPSTMHAEGTRLIKQTLGEGAPGYLTSINTWMNKVRRLSIDVPTLRPAAYPGDVLHPETVARKAGVP